MPLAPEYEAMFAQLAESPAPGLHELSVAEGREMYRLMRPKVEELPIGSVTEQTISGSQGPIQLRIYTPDQPGPHPVYVNYHGGGWVIGDLDTADAACRDLSMRLPCIVVSVDYALAPEARFPSAVEDSYAALLWAAEQQQKLGGNGQLIVGGESAGGNLAAVVSLMARDEAGPSIAAQVLWYPVVDHDLSGDSYVRNGDGYLLTTATMGWFWEHYCAAEARADWRASPLRAANHQDLPPAVIATAEFDPLTDEGAAYAKILQDAGSAVEHTEFTGLVHDFCATAPLFGCSREAVDKVYAQVRGLLGG